MLPNQKNEIHMTAQSPHLQEISTRPIENKLGEYTFASYPCNHSH